MTEDIKTHDADDPQNPNNLVVRGRDGDPLPHPTGTRMIEIESYERVIEGLKMAADACMHLAKIEPLKGSVWTDIARMLDKMRREASGLAGLDLQMAHEETKLARGAPYSWKKARDRFLDGLRQATGGMRQLATCFRGDFNWTFLAQQLERYEKNFRDILKPQPFTLYPTEELAAQGARATLQRPVQRLILPPGFVARG